MTSPPVQQPELRFASLTRLIAPRSVAIVGASADPTRIGGRPIAYMLAQNFAGPILPVNPKRREIQGLPAYHSVADLPETPDVAIVAVPGELAVQAVDDLGKRGVKAVDRVHRRFRRNQRRSGGAGQVGRARARARDAAARAELSRPVQQPHRLLPACSRRASRAASRAPAASVSRASPARTARIFTPRRATAAWARRFASPPATRPT